MKKGQKEGKGKGKEGIRKRRGRYGKENGDR